MMQQEFKMNSEKKVYCKPEMDIVDMAYEQSVLQACSGDCGPIETEYSDTDE